MVCDRWPGSVASPPQVWPQRVTRIGPIAAVERLLARGVCAPSDTDAIELNEAFAAQILACSRAWGLADDDLWRDPRGGSIGMCHPLGMSGTCFPGTAARYLAETVGKTAPVTLCVGVGQGVALELLAV